ncbi:MAG: HPF/RaiA family ribosome-associated protein [Deltaproteobacteria bacterium]|nr:HPF/RaiA family ribosome-associated protein [Deltaproteobacteria bacterium]
MDVHIEGQNLEILPEWREKINEELDRLQEMVFNPILHARVEIIGTRHHHLGAFEVHLVLTVAGDVITINHQGEFVPPLLVEAFDTLSRRLLEHSRIKQREIKTHEEFARQGKIIRLFPLADYGFIEDQDGLEIYFHTNALKKGKFEKLARGTRVKFAFEDGEKGPQATWVQPLG